MVENRWRELCEAIMKEQDPHKLSALVKELNVALDQRELELQGRRSANGQPPAQTQSSEG
jgi:hypothetical protein